MRRELVLPLVFFFGMILLPYFIAVFSAGSNYHFGGFLFNVYDGNSYLAKMYQGYQGDWRFTLPYTAEPGRGAYLFLFYILLGHISRWISISPIYIFHFARIISAGLLAAVLHHLVATARGRKSTSIWGFTLLLLGSGCGWLLSLWGQLGADFWVAEAYPFLSSFATPHFALGLALLVWIFLEANRYRSGKQGLLLVGLAFCLSVIAPFAVVVAAAVLAAVLAGEIYVNLLNRPARSTVADEPEIGRPGSTQAFYALLMVLTGGVPFLIYQLLAIRSDPVLSGWNAQNLTPSVPVWNVIVSFSPAFIVGMLWLFFAWRRKLEANFLCSIWLLAGFLLLYIPFDLQRRFMMGLFIPAACLAGAGIQALAGKSPRKANLLGVALVLFSMITNLVILASTFHGISNRDPLIYLSQDEAAALEWIVGNTGEQALVLASPEMGLFIPAHTGRRVIYGHPFETVNALVEKQAVTDFFTSSADMDRQAFLDARRVDYVLIGQRERSYQPPEMPDSLVAIFSTAEVVIYRVAAPPD
jgi:hypothetical protein